MIGNHYGQEEEHVTQDMLNAVYAHEKPRQRLGKVQTTKAMEGYIFLSRFFFFPK